MPLERLRRLLDQAEAPIAFWWRDDDAGRAHPRLEQLLALAEELDCPLALAVVPGWLEPAARDAILACPQATVLAHGWRHANHAAPETRKIELGGTIDRALLRQQLLDGRAVLEAAFGARFLPVQVPPWNRMAADMPALLPGLGFVGVSSWAGTDLPEIAGLRRRDVMVNPIAAGTDPVRLDPAQLVRQIEASLARSPAEPIGLMTHHLVFDEDAFLVWRRLMMLLRGHANSRLLTAATVFGG